MPQVTTAYDPDTSQGWHFVDERVVAQGPPGTQVVDGYNDSGGPAVLGFDLWGNINLDDIINRVQAQGVRVYYASRWRNPPSSFLAPFVGIDNYRVCWVADR